jgi:hypothetical protein
VTIGQSRFEADRGKGLDIALAVENYVTRERRVNQPFATSWCPDEDDRR